MSKDVSAVLYDVPRRAARFLDLVRLMDEVVLVDEAANHRLNAAWREFHTLALAAVMGKAYPATPEGTNP